MSPFKVINPPEAASPSVRVVSQPVGKSSRLAGEQLASRVGPLTHSRVLEPLALYSVRDATRVSETAAIARRRLMAVESDCWTDKYSIPF